MSYSQTCALSFAGHHMARPSLCENVRQIPRATLYVNLATTAPPLYLPPLRAEAGYASAGSGCYGGSDGFGCSGGAGNAGAAVAQAFAAAALVAAAAAPAVTTSAGEVTGGAT